MAQNTDEYGKIISATEGEKLFASVIASYEIITKDLLTYCQNAGRAIMFAEENGELYVAGLGRKILSFNQRQPSQDLVFHVYGVSKVDELLTRGKDEVTVVEIRSDLIDLKNGEFILEYGFPCPPYCG